MYVYAPWVPGELLLDARLTATDKLVAIMFRLRPSLEVTGSTSDRALASRCGVARGSIARCRVRLKSAGWLEARPGYAKTHGRARFPVGLLVDRELSNQAKILYAVLQLTKGFNGFKGWFTYRELARLTGVSRPTLWLAVQELEGRGWFEITLKKPRAPIQFVMKDPVLKKNDRLIRKAERKLRLARNLGEQITREFFNVIVDQEYQDNATPSFLLNPYNDAEMEFDRYYPHTLAIEFNGPQHYGPTEKYPDPVEALKQQARDAIKKSICKSRGIRLVIVEAKDLTLKTLLKKVGRRLRRRNLDEYGPLIAFLEEKAEWYREKAKKGSVAARGN